MGSYAHLKLDATNVGLKVRGWTQVGPEFSCRRHRFAVMQCCSCRQFRVVRIDHLNSGRTSRCFSCAVTTHGTSQMSERRIWHRMIDRCHNKKHKLYHRYGGRGIRVCDEWRGAE